MSRRGLLAHCSALVWLGSAVGIDSARAQTTSAAPVILIVGDSLSAEYGLARGTGWVALLTKRLAERKSAATVINASISGDTTAGGRSRLAALLKLHHPTCVILELGGNDALRGLPLETTRANLVEMAQASKAAGAKVLIVGMQVPPNYGRKYGEDFAELFSAVAKSEGTALVPFLLAGIADVPEAESMFQADRIHPRAEAHPRMLENVWASLAPLLKLAR